MNATKEFSGIYVAPKAAIYLVATLKEDIPSPVQRIPINSRNLINWVRTGLMTPELRHVRGHELILSFEDLVKYRNMILRIFIRQNLFRLMSKFLAPKPSNLRLLTVALKRLNFSRYS